MTTETRKTGEFVVADINDKSRTFVVYEYTNFISTRYVDGTVSEEVSGMVEYRTKEGHPVVKEKDGTFHLISGHGGIGTIITQRK
jgi:hypothetical protein